MKSRQTTNDIYNNSLYIYICVCVCVCVCGVNSINSNVWFII